MELLDNYISEVFNMVTIAVISISLIIFSLTNTENSVYL
jgi:hypothetical protein